MRVTNVRIVKRKESLFSNWKKFQDEKKNSRKAVTGMFVTAKGDR